GGRASRPGSPPRRPRVPGAGTEGGSYRRAAPREHVHDAEDHDPDAVDEVPVDGHALLRRAVVGAERTREVESEHAAEHDQADEHVESVETREREEAAAEEAGCE